MKTLAVKDSSFTANQRFSPGTAAGARQAALWLALVALLDEVVHQFARGVVHLHVEGFHAAGKIVEGHNGGDGDEQSEGRGDKGFRDTAGDRADTRGLLGRDGLEGVQNSDDGAQQADERSGGTDRRQSARPRFSLA